MAGVPYIFGNATTSIPLTNLDANFNTGLTIGNTTVGLGNTVTTLGNVTLNNVTINSGTSNVSPANVVATTLTIGGVALGAGDASIMKNRIINGAMVIDQRNAGASATLTNTGYSLDRWQTYLNPASKYTVQQNAGSVTPPVGFTNYLGVTSTSAYSVSAGDYQAIAQPIEGYNIADLGFGTANAKTITVSFWVRSSLTGVFGGALANNGASRSYPYTYTISSANTWEQKSITIAGDTTGTWNTNNTFGLSVIFGLGVGSTFSGTAGSWASVNYISATGATSVVGTSGATFYITGVQLEVGSSATGFEYRMYSTELANCYRYCQVYGRTNAACMMVGQCYTTSQAYSGYQFIAPMRAAPTLSYSALSDWAVNTAGAGASILTAWSIVNATTQNAETIFTGTGVSLVPGNATALQAQNANATFTLSAEL